MCETMARYRSACVGLAEELEEALSSADVDALRDALSTVGFSGWKTWEHENREAISAFLRATPAQRQRKKAWSDPDKQRLLIFAALQQAHLAVAVLDARELLNPGRSWRDTCADAAELGHSIVDSTLWYWPFGAPNPFVS